jgi:NAD+ synthase (glutamine-hydrolysing)
MDNIIIAQINFKVGALAENFEKIIDLVQANSGKTIIFSELAICGYFAEDLLVDLNFVYKISSYLLDIAKVSARCDASVIIGAPIVEDEKLYNAALYISEGDIRVVHKKIYLPNRGVFDEERYFCSGDGVSQFNLGGKKVICIICEDFWKIEASALACEDNLDFLIVLNASPFETGKLMRRIERGKFLVQKIKCPIMYVNLVGAQDSIVFDGNSFVLYPDKKIALMDSVIEQVKCINNIDIIDTEILDNNKFADIYNVICLGIRDYFAKNNQHKALIAFSGGIDSALCAALTIDALGKENVRLITLPSRYTGNLSYIDAKYLIDAYNVETLNISIENLFNELQSSLSPAFKSYSEDVTEENMQSRIRGLIMMSLSNKYNALLITTGNKSEYACGYATIYGDMCGALAPIKDVFKTDVYKLAHWRNNNIPVITNNNYKSMFSDSILVKPPTAELRFDQKDSDSLPEYSILDIFLKEFIEKKSMVEDIKVVGLDDDTKYKIINMIRLSEYKRRQSAIGIKVSECSFDKDWRFPIANNYIQNE